MAMEAAGRSPSTQTIPIRFIGEWFFRRRILGRRMAWFLVFTCLLYAGTFVVLLALEDRLLFPGATGARAWHEPPDYLHIREVTLDSAMGERIGAWFSAPDGWEPCRGAILYSHGNRGNVSCLASRAHHWRDATGRAVLLYDYPGYGKSSGRPSERGCYAAGEAALRWLEEVQRVPAGEVIRVGESMGGAVATELATRHAVRLLVLHGAFTSFPDMAQMRVPIYPSRYLVHNQMDNEAKIGHVHCPVLITHGTADAIVPFHQGERLFAAAAEPKRFIRMEDHGHGPPVTVDFFEGVRRFLAETRQSHNKCSNSHNTFIFRRL
jgi:pimeloyl-ACP methyl ester carboxylesterase